MTAKLFTTISDFRCKPKEKNMRTIITMLLLGAAKLTATDDIKFIEAIAQVESGGRDDAVGPCGSISRYQIMPSTWRMHTQWPISDSSRPLKAQIVAVKHLRYLKTCLKTSDDYFVLACAWKCGPGYGSKKETNKQLTDRLEYAARVLNVFNELKTN